MVLKVILFVYKSSMWIISNITLQRATQEYHASKKCSQFLFVENLIDKGVQSV